MAKHKITYQENRGKNPEEVDASGYRQDGDWWTFQQVTSGRAGVERHDVLTVRTADVSRIERLD